MVDRLKKPETPESASDWLIAMREAPDDAVLREKFNDWLESNPANINEWHQVNHVAAMIRAMSPSQNAGLGLDQDEQDEPDRHREIPELSIAAGRGPTGREKPSRRNFLAGGCMAIVAVFVGIVVLRDSGQANLYETASAEIRQIELDDKSIITLAPQSEVEIDYAGDVRHVTLHDGMAFFDVAKNPERPFVVQTNQVTVRVLGTAFEVKTGDDVDRVSVQQGIVAVASNRSGDSQELHAGDRLALPGDGSWQQSRMKPETVSSWRNGVYVAQNDRLGDLVDELSDYYSGYIYVADDALRDMPLTGVFSLKEPEDALEILAQSHNLSLRHVSPWIMILAAK
jgi:transmembrane sensor